MEIWKPLNIFTESSILDIWLGSEYASDGCRNLTSLCINK